VPKGSRFDQEALQGYVQVENARLYYRTIGRGMPAIVLHGGPDFDHHYLLPELDRLSSGFRLIYYDQRGRGRSGRGIEPEQVSMASEIADLHRVMEHFDLRQAVLLGHSWGGLLALEFALRHPHPVSHVILLNSAPVSEDDLQLFRLSRQRTAAADLEAMRTLSITAGYAAGDLDMDAAYYRMHFKTAMYRPEHLESVIERLRADMTPEGIRKARAIEQRLYEETWLVDGYSLLPLLNRLSVPTLVIHGDQDFIPLACAEHIAQAIPGARLAVLQDCGHFSFLEQPEQVERLIAEFCLPARQV
jgi:proline iminopeptidase